MLGNNNVAVAGTRNDWDGEDGRGIFANHAYTVVNMQGTGMNATIVLRNPHGGEDQEVSLSYQEFVARFDSMVVASVVLTSNNQLGWEPPNESRRIANVT